MLAYDRIVYDNIVYDIQDLVKIYPGQARPANNHINLQIAAGEIFGLLGDNGAGKTTLVRQMANLLRTTSGQITFFGQRLVASGGHSQQIPCQVGYMPQETAAINNLTVGEALYFTAHLRGLERPAAQREVARLLRLWQIEHLRARTGPQLSGGERRLTYLALAMAGSPPVLILDEPTNDLDPQRRNQVWDILRQQNQAHGVTVIFITHDAIEAEKIIQRVGILRNGSLLALGRPAQLKAQVDRKLRLQIAAASDLPPVLPPGVELTRLDAGRWLAYVAREQAAAVIQGLQSQAIDDFSLHAATLEDLYLYYVSHTNHKDHEEHEC